MFSFTRCPICSCSLSQGVESCRRCGAQLLCLAKVRGSAELLRAQGKESQANALLKNRSKTDVHLADYIAT